ncbi:hypothetical protein T492DRAFT_871567, partial [Pavlovales sp. CCMP2436]
DAYMRAALPADTAGNRAWRNDLGETALGAQESAAGALSTILPLKGGNSTPALTPLVASLAEARGTSLGPLSGSADGRRFSSTGLGRSLPGRSALLTRFS